MRYMLYILDYNTGEVLIKSEGTEQECAEELGSFMKGWLECRLGLESFVGRFRFTRWDIRYAGEICPIEPDDPVCEEGTLISLLDDEE